MSKGENRSQIFAKISTSSQPCLLVKAVAIQWRAKTLPKIVKVSREKKQNPPRNVISQSKMIIYFIINIYSTVFKLQNQCKELGTDVNCKFQKEINSGP